MSEQVKNEGGFAFPGTWGESPGLFHCEGGMTLRQWYAAQALAGQAAYAGLEGCGSEGSENGAADVAAWCFEAADAMLAHEAKKAATS